MHCIVFECEQLVPSCRLITSGALALDSQYALLPEATCGHPVHRSRRLFGNGGSLKVELTPAGNKLGVSPPLVIVVVTQL